MLLKIPVSFPTRALVAHASFAYHIHNRPNVIGHGAKLETIVPKRKYAVRHINK